MARKKELQTTFIAGELDPKLALRVDIKQYNNGAKSLLNRRCLIGGGTSRRPGTLDLTPLPGSNRIVEFVFNEVDQAILVFWTNAMYAYSSGGAFLGGFGGAPWTFPAITEMDFMQQGNTVIVTHFTFPPQVITRTGFSSWTLAPFAFLTNGPRTEQPYFKIAGTKALMRPSGYEGAIIVDFNEAILNGTETGSIFRYLGREIRVDSVNSPSQFSGTVLERLPPTFILVVQDATTFTTGESVIGADSLAKGVVSSISLEGNALMVYSRNASSTAG